MKEYDAILAHGYMFPYKDRDARMGLRNHMQASALATMKKEGKVGKIVVPGGKWWGEDKPAFAELFASELQRKGIAVDAIIANPQTTSTSEEIDVFLKERQKHGWESVASLANRVHNKRVGVIYTQRGENIDLINAEDVLHSVTRRGKRPYEKFLRRFSGSKMELLFTIRESIVTWLYTHGFEERLVKLSHNPVVNKIKSVFDR